MNLEGLSLQDAIEAAGGAVDLLRDLGVGRFTKLPAEFTHWIEEQRAWRETCALMDLSYHMADFDVTGPDALELFGDYAVNDFTDFAVGRAKQLVVANPEGYFIGDAILFRLSEAEFLTVGPAPALNWLDFQAETGAYDVSTDLRGRAVSTREDPKYYRYQIQGPNAVDVADVALDGDLPEIGFFGFAPVSIGGHEAFALRHGMAGERGYELFGPYAEGAAVREILLEVGGEHGVRRVGAEAYQTPAVVLGWLPLPVPAIYTSDEMVDYREWLPAKRGILSIGGSFESSDISDYYVTPVEMGYERVIDLDHDFVGKEAIEAELGAPSRTKVTLVWDANDVIETYASLFRDGDTYKFLDLPHPRWAACPYDVVRKDGEPVGVSTDKAYLYNEREMLSLAIVDVAHAEPGTAVELVLGEPDPTANPKVERHVQTTIGATVAPTPYREDKRQ